jgi:hypothetical protein
VNPACNFQAGAKMSKSKISNTSAEDIILTAFIYTDDDCFDADGNYIGLVSDTITVIG